MEQVKMAALNNAPALLLAKTTGFFDNMCCTAYMKEQVAAEPIELDYEGDDNSIMVPAFMWMDIDESGVEEYKSEGEWTDDEADDCASDCEVFSRSPTRKIVIVESDRTPAPPSYPLTKSPSRSQSTATTVTENSCITSHSWETEFETELSLSIPDPASYESVVPKIKSISISKSRAPWMIPVPSFKLKQRQSPIDVPYILGSSMSMPDM
jgi:hypothetical protein